MPEIIVFLDIDGTLLDVEQRTNTDGLPALVAELRELGVRFGLNSNRAIEDVLPVAKRFGLDGPFILENGAYVMDALDAVPVPTHMLATNIPEIVETTLRTCAAQLYPHAIVERTDTTHLVSIGAFKAGQRFYMNRFRRFSASIHHRFDGEAQGVVAQTLSDTLNRLFDESGHALRAVAHAHGATVTVNIPGIDKGTGLAFLRSRIPRAYVIAIGDGSGDVALRPYVDRLYAVSNAVPELKNVADAIALQPMTLGVVELLRERVRPLADGLRERIA